MRAVIQRVSEGSVKVSEETVGRIGNGLLVLLGVARDDDRQSADFLAEKIPNLRIFEDAAGKFNLSLLDIGGEMLVVSQFTLLGDCRKGRRPSFVDAAPPEKANDIYEHFVEKVRQKGIRVETGRFRRHNGRFPGQRRTGDAGTGHPAGVAGWSGRVRLLAIWANAGYRNFIEPRTEIVPKKMTNSNLMSTHTTCGRFPGFASRLRKRDRLKSRLPTVAHAASCWR